MAFCSIDHISRIPAAIAIYFATVFNNFGSTHATPQFPPNPVYITMIRLHHFQRLRVVTADDDLAGERKVRRKDTIKKDIVVISRNPQV
jgi:hypothetical protein